MSAHRVSASEEAIAQKVTTFGELRKFLQAKALHETASALEKSRAAEVWVGIARGTSTQRE